MYVANRYQIPLTLLSLDNMNKVEFQKLVDDKLDLLTVMLKAQEHLDNPDKVLECIEGNLKVLFLLEIRRSGVPTICKAST